MRAPPPQPAVNRPVEETEIDAGSLLDHVTARLVSVFPSASRTVARNCRVVPARITESTGDTSTEAGTPVEVVPVENVDVSRAGNASTATSRTCCVTMSLYSLMALQGAS